MNPNHVAPRNVYELRLWQIWSGALHRDDLGVKDDFFGLGGDRAMAETVLAAIASQLDAPLSMEAFLEEPTIEHAACRLRARSRRLNEEPVVALQPDGGKRPFFFVPSGEGNVHNFHGLARRMAPDQPFYGLQPRGLHGERPPFDRIEDMAADHIESMRAVQPRGPYLLGGHCIGAMIALEMALQLQRRGERVALLASIDGLAPAPFYRDDVLPLVMDPLEALIFVGRGFEIWFGVRIPLTREMLLAVDPDRRPALLTDLARRHGVYTPDEPDERASRVLDYGARICRAGYMPKDAYAGSIAFFRALESELCQTPTGGWEEVSTQPPRVREIPGGHVTLVTEPCVDRLAHELRAAIAEASV